MCPAACPVGRIRYPVSLASQLNGKAGFSLATTVRTTSQGTMLFGLSDQTLLWSRVYAGLSSGRFEFGGRSQRRELEPYQFTLGTAQVNDGQFHTLVGVMDLPADRLSLYVDGVLDRTSLVLFNLQSFEAFTPADGNFVGHLTGYADSALAPDVTHDEVALWDVALNEFQAATVRWLGMTGRSLREWIGF